MSNYRGFNLFSGATVVETHIATGASLGNTFTIRANTSAENQEFKDWIDLLLDDDSISAAFQIAAESQAITLRAIPINSEFSAYSGSDPDRAAYSASGFKSSDSSTFDAPNSRFTQRDQQFSTNRGVVHLNFATRATYLTQSGAGVSAPNAQIVFIHELAHALNRQFIASGDYIREPDSGFSTYEEQITIFFTNFVHNKTTGLIFERVGHETFSGQVGGQSRSSVSYLRDAKLKKYEFLNSNFAPLFELADGSTIRKTYYKGTAANRGADRVEIYYNSGNFNESKAMQILAESAVNNSDPLNFAKNKIRQVSSYIEGKWEFAPEAMVTLSGERIRSRIGTGTTDVEGPRQDAQGFVVSGARTNEPEGLFDSDPPDARTLIFGSAGWKGNGVGKSGAGNLSASNVAAKDKLIGGDNDDILITFSEQDGNELSGGYGNDLLVGSSKVDRLLGGRDDDALLGEDGDDELDGGSGHDFLDGGAGKDTILGGIGNDKLLANADGEDDVLDGGGGADTVVYEYGGGNSVIEIVSATSNPPPPLLPRNRTSQADFGLNIFAAEDGAGNAVNYGNDQLISIELAAVNAGQGVDRLVLTEISNVSFIDYIDLGDQPSNAFDTIDLRGWDEDVSVDLSVDTVAWIEESIASPITDIFDSTVTLEVRNAEKVLGGAGSDVLLGGVIPNTIRVSRGPFAERLEDAPLVDRVVSSNANLKSKAIELFGGEGDDAIFLSAGTGSRVVGGEGNDLLYNASFRGELWGDGLDGRGAASTGVANSDTFWWSAGTFIKDAGKNDRLQLFGVPLVGGTNESYFGASLEKGTARDFFLPWVTYGLTDSGQLLVDATTTAGADLDPDASENEILKIAQIVEKWESGDLGIEFSIFGGGDEISLFRALGRFIGDWRRSANRFAKNRDWRPVDDPLVLDLNGDGLVSKGIGAVYWDNDGDLFGERSGWLSGEDGLLVHDADGDGQITAPELFGGPGLSGYTELSDWDSNGNNIVDANDVGFGDLQIWRDANENGITDAGELHALAAFDITAFSLNAQPVNLITANGTTIRAESFYARADGTTGALGELIFETDPSDTRYQGDGRVAGFVPNGVSGDPIDAFGYGITTDLAVAASNDLELAKLIESTAAAMTVADLDALREQARPLLGAWARSHADSLELGAALIGADGALLDHAVYTEDESGGFWTLASGADVLASDGSAIARSSFEDVLAQVAADGASWQAIQGWSPSSREFTPENRLETAYLVSTSGVAAAVLDYAIQQTDAQGEFWTLASGDDILTSDGLVIARASLADIMSQAAAAGSEWRMEDFAEPIPDAGFDRAAFYLRDGVVTDYSIWIDDGNGLFAVWASVFEQALESQELYGPNSFGLRGFELDLDTLPDADNSDDSAVRVEIMTLDEIQFAFASGGETFRPELFVAQSQADNTLSYDFDIDDTKEFAATLANSFLAIGRAMAVRIASQGGLAQYFEGVEYNAANDTFQATSGRELIPLFTAILADAPAGADQTVGYLREWDRVLQTVYPDFKRNGRGPRSQAFLMQMLVAGFENSPVDASFLQVAEALSIDEERVLVADTDNTDVDGTRGDDLIYISDGAASARGGLGSDVYIVGRDFGEVTIQDVEPILQPSASDYLRFAHLTPDDVFVTKDGADLIIQEVGTGNILTIRNQFEGRWPGIFGGDFSDNTEITEIVFADGTAWDFVDMAYAASHPLDSNDVVFGTDSIDVLDGGAGNDILRGGGDSDLYVFDYNYGEDRIIDSENNPFREGVDLVTFGEGIDAERLSFQRVGESNDVIIRLLDEAGERTGDILTIEGQFFQQDAFITKLRPNRIEILAFEDGTFLDEKGIRDRVIAEAKTDGEDAIFAFDDSETLDGGAGNDLLVGKDGADTYIFERGYGDDVIQDQSFEVGIGVVETINRLQLRGINAADIEILRDPGSPTIGLRIKDTGETVTLKNQFQVTFVFFTIWEDNVDLIEFADGTVWDQDRLGREVLALERTDGDDTIIGFDWSDTLDGGAGDDRLEGGLYNDTYVFREGYGNDTVFDTGAGKNRLLPAGFDTLDLRGINLVDVEFSRAANDLTLTLRSTGESVTLEGQYDRLGDTVVENISFDGVDVDWRDLGADDIDLIGTSGDDTLIGTHYAERIDGRAGNDLLIGSSDGDTYVFDIGYGQDVIDDTIDAGKYRAGDTIEFGANVNFADVRFTIEGNDLLISVIGFTDSLRVLDQFGSVLAGVENFLFADGNTLTIDDVEEQLQIAGGTRGDNIIDAIDDRENILDGRQGDDQLNGGSFGDTYLFGVGYGFDTITEKLDSASQPGAVDRVVFGRLVDPADVVFRADGTNLIVTIPSSGEQLTIIDGLGARQIEQFDFYDDTIWGQAEIREALLRGTDGDDLLIGFDNTDDVIAGGLGSDLLVGKAGNDTYRFNIGDGLDAIEDSSGVDRVELGEGISAGMLRFSQVDEGLLIQFEGIEDSLLIRGGLNPATAIETVALADGFEFEFEDIRSLVLAGQQTINDDIIRGFANRADRIEGGAGNDELVGLSGDDFYIIGENPGIDIVSDTGGTDRLRFTAGSSQDIVVRRPTPGSGDLAISFTGQTGETIIRGALTVFADTIEEFEFADGAVFSLDDLLTRFVSAPATDGDDIIRGLDNDRDNGDTFDGGLGNDIIIGNDAPDVFIFRRGDGQDLIRANGGGLDVLRIEGYAPEDLSFRRFDDGAYDWVIEFAGTDDRIILGGQGFNSVRIDQIEFSDGQVITAQDIISLSLPTRQSPSDGNDILHNRTELDGGLGDDILIGSNDPNTYFWRSGNGNDIIREQDSYEGSDSSIIDTLFLEGLNQSDITVARGVDDPLSIVLTIIDTGETLAIDGTPFDAIENGVDRGYNPGIVQRDESGGHWIERIVFADGSEISQRDLEQQIYDAERTDGADVIDAFGSPTVNFFNPAVGAYLDGGAGDDTYRSRFDIAHVRMTAGQGSDTLELERSNARVRVQLDGLELNNVRTFKEYREGEVYSILRAATGEELVVKGDRSFTLLDENGNAIERRESDGLLEGTAGRDFLEGRADFSSDFGLAPYRDTFRPGGGDDIIFGRGAGDGFVGVEGFSNDNPNAFDTVILEVGDGLNWLYSDSRYIVELGVGFDPADVAITWLNDGTDNIRIDFNLTGDGVIVGSQDIGSISYADGTVLYGTANPPQLEEIELQPSSSSVFNSDRDEIFRAVNGGVRLRLTDDSGQDFLIDEFLSDGVAEIPIEQQDWTPSRIDLRDGNSLSDFEFVQDTSSPSDLIVRNLLTGSAIRIVGQFVDAPEQPDPYQDVPVDPITGLPDWYDEATFEGPLPQAFDILLGLDTDNDGQPNWLNPDADGDGVADWTSEPIVVGSLSASLDIDGDGDPEVFAFDSNDDGVFDDFEIELANGDYLYLYDTDGDNILDEYDTDSGQSGFLVRDILDGSIRWDDVDTDNDGVSDIAIVDFDGDGAPDLENPDVDGDGVSDWVFDDGPIVILNPTDPTDPIRPIGPVGPGGEIETFAVPGAGVVNRRLDPETGEYVYQLVWEEEVTIFGPGFEPIPGFEEVAIVARDSDGDQIPDQFAYDRNVDFLPDEQFVELRSIVSDFVFYEPTGPDSVRLNFFDWSELLDEGLVIQRDESAFAIPSNDVPQLDIDALRIQASAGDDALVAREGETVNGLAGNDGILLTGDNVTVEFGAGSGNDFVYRDFDIFTAQSNILQLVGINSLDEVAFEASEDRSDLTVTIIATGESIKLVDQLTFRSVFSEFRLADGTSFTAAEIEGSLVEVSGFTNLIEGGDGNDRLTSVNNSFSIDDTLRGGLGDDLLYGGEGDDTYLYSIGDGFDIIDDSEGTAGVLTRGNDTLRISGASSADMQVSDFNGSARDLLLDFGGGDAILIENGFSTFRDIGIERVIFEETGEVLTQADLIDRVLLDRATPNDNFIEGTDLSNTLTGGAGEDILAGEAGDDTYIFKLGDGNDRIVDSEGSADRIIFSDFTAADISGLFRSPPAGFDLIINFASGDTAILADALRDGDEGVDFIEFADGQTITPDDLRSDLLAGFDNASDAQIYGFSGADSLAGGAGDDSLFGLGGDDTYTFRAGDGNDRIEDNGGGTDRVIIEGYDSTDVRLSRIFYASTGAVLSFIGAPDDSLTLVNITSEGEDRIEFIEFADGVVWDFATIEALLGNNAPVVNPDGFRDVVQGEVLEIDSAILLSNDFDADEDPLSVQSLGEVTGGTATLRGDGVIEFTADPEFTGFASIAYLVSDGRQGFADATLSVRVRPVAIANDDTGITVLEDETLVIRDRDLLANDVDGDRFEVSQVKDAVGGTVSLSSNGDIAFTPFAQFNGSASFVYVANTPDGGRDEALVEIDVLAVNDAPVAASDATGLSTNEGVPIVIDAAAAQALLNNDSDIDGDTLSISGVSGDGNINAELNDDGSILITPLGDFFGLASFTYIVDDGAGGTDTATATLFVNPVNDAPVTAADNLTTDEDTPIFISGDQLTANDFDPDGTPVVISAVGSASGGRVELFENNTILFTPGGNFNGLASFAYLVDDGEGGVTSETVSVEINPVNDRPNAVDDRPFGRNGNTALVTQQDEVLIIDPASLLSNDFDIDSTGFTLDTVTNAINGDVELRGDGLIYFTPDADFWGFASFKYAISDDQNAVDDGNVSVFFRPTGNVAPVAIDDRFTGVEDQPLIITREQLLGNDFDPNGDAIKIVGSVTGLGASTNEIQNWFWNEDDDLVIVPIPDLPGSGTLFYTISDGVFTDRARIDVSFAPIDDAPTANDDAGFESGFGRPVVLRISDLKANDFDIDESIWLSAGGFAHRFGASNAEILEALTTSNGTANIYGDEFIVIEVGTEFNGDLALGYTLEDPTGLSDQANVSTFVRSERDLVIEGSDLRDLLIGSEEGETLIGGAGVDDLFGRGGDDILRGGDDADLLDGGEGFDIADFSDSLVALRVDINSRIGQGGFAQGDELVSIEGLIGGAGGDQLFGTDELNTLAGGAGNDILDGRGGDDALSGDEGDDTLIGREGADALDGGAGVDTADYSDSAAPVAVSLTDGTASGGDAEGDTLTSIENLIGSIGDDTLTGDAEANYIDGGRGADTIATGGGDDLIEGGRGGDIIDGGEGVDTARYWLSESGVAIDLAAGTASDGDAEGDQISNVEDIIGSAHQDTITGDAKDNVIAGGGSGDTLDGGDGIDTLDYSDSVDGIAIDLGAGTGSQGDADSDIVSNFENVIGSRLSDQIIGDDGDNILDGSIGDDELTGAAGSDRYILSRGSGSDTIIEASALTDSDTVEIIGDYSPETVSIYADGDDLIVELEQDDGVAPDLVRIKDHFLGDGTGIETLVFGDGTEWDRATIEANAAASRLQAEGDIVRLVDEDTPFTFAASDLLVNDVAPEGAVLSVISVEALSGGSVTLNGDNTITFLGDQDFNGDAFFRYRMADETGRISSAVVEVNVRPVNDNPVAVDDEGGFVVDEDGSISIPFAWLLGNDSDIDGDELTIGGLERIADGNGTANVEQAGFVTFRPDADYSGSAGFRYRVSDRQGGFANAEVSLEVLPVNDAPRPAGDSASVRSGSDILISVAALLSNDGDPEGDAFSFAGIGQGQNGTAALEIIDGAQFVRFTPDDGYVGGANFTYSVTEDATGLVGSASVNVTVLPPNDPPVANGETLDGLEDTPLVIDSATLLANDTDPNGDTLFVSRLDEFPEQGSVEFDTDGNIVFTPAPDYNGPASFKYWVSDGEFEAEATASIEVAAINDAPVVVDDGPFVGDEDKVFVVRAADVFGNDSDREGDLLEFAEFETDIGQIVRDGVNLLLTPPLDYNGPITVRYRARDEKGAVSEDFATVTIEISDIPDAPEAVADSFTTEEDTPLALVAADLIGNDTDVDSTELTLLSVENAVGGVVSLVNGVVTFTPNTDFFGEASFDYLVTDGDTNPVTGTVSIEVTPVNDAVRVTGDSFATDEDVALNLAPSAFLANDIDPDGDTITITAVTAITEGASAVIEADGTITLTPPANESGQIRFEYTVADEAGLETVGQVSVFVAAVNDAPVLDIPLPDQVSAEDAAFSFAIDPASFSDIDSTMLTLSASLTDDSGLPDWLAFDGTNLTGTPPQHFNGLVDITITANDGELSVSDAFTLTIDPVNDAPMLVQVVADQAFNEDTAISVAVPSDTFEDVDGDALVLSATLADGSELPSWLSFDGTTFTGTPPQDFNGSLDLTVIASDGEFTAEETFTLSIDPANDAPVLVQALADVSSDEDAAISVAIPVDAFSDIDGDALALEATLSDGSDLPSWLSFDGATFTGIPPQDFNGSLNLTLIASDGELTAQDSFTLTIDPVNDAPVIAQALVDVSTLEDEAISIAVPADTFADIDGDALTLSATLLDGAELPDWLSFDGKAFTGFPPRDFNGTLYLSVTASDGDQTAMDTFALTIDPVNDAPILTQALVDAVSLEDTAISVAVPQDAFADIDGDALTLVANLSDGSDLPSWLSFDGTAFTGTPPQDFNGAIELEITASDGLLTISDTFTLTIDPVNDAPTLVQALGDVVSAEDTGISISIPADAFADLDGDVLTVSAGLADGSDLPAWLSFDGVTFIGTPPQDFNGALELSVTARDSEQSVSDTFALTIDPINDAPVLAQALADVSSDEDAGISFVIPEGRFADVDGDALTFTAALNGGNPLPAWLNFDGSAFTGTPPVDFNGTLQITVTAGDGEYAAEGGFSLTITPVNDAPVLIAPLSAQRFDEDTPVSFSLETENFADVDGDTLAFTAELESGGTLPNWLAFDGTNFTGTPPQDFNGDLRVSVTATDGEFSVSDTFNLTITPVNDAPLTVGELEDITIFGSEAFDWVVPADIFADTDGDTLTLSATTADSGTLPSWVSFDGDRFTGIAPDDFDGIESFTVTASDGEFSSSASFDVTIIDPNDPPVVGDDGIFVGIQAQDLVILRRDLLANDFDPDGDPLSIVSFETNGAGSVSFDADGNIVYSVDSTFVGTDSFSYTISDGSETATGTVNVRIDSQFTGWSEGSAGDDRLFGNNKAINQLFGGDGDDHVKGGKLNDRLAGGNGNDRLQGLNGDDELWGGAGDDDIKGNGGFDTAFYFGLRDSYAIQTVNGTVQVVDAAPTIDGDDGTDTISSIELLSFKNGETASVVSPIILDLAGDGIETVSAGDSDALFDLDGDGLADDTSWIGSGDAFLYLDRDGNGTMSGVEEISFVDDVPDATTDLAGLVAFDSNGDGVLNADDERFTEFGVWQDADGDGAVDDGETASLAQVGIASVDLTGTAVNGTVEFGEVAIANTGSFTLVNGARREFADAALTYFSAATNMTELSVTNYGFDRKAKKYRIHIGEGIVSVDRKRRRSDSAAGAGQLGANTLLTFGNKTYGRFAPVVLDLDGDGVELVKRRKSNAAFDYDGNGGADDTGWISGDDGFLVIDRNNDGLITEASELSLAAENDDARTGLQGLAAMDSNRDGVIDTDDARFGELRVWQDRNANGRTDSGELMTLEEAGIVSISLAASGLQDRVKVTKNAVTATSSFTRSNGTTSTVADVSLAYQPGAGVRAAATTDLRARTTFASIQSQFYADLFETEAQLPANDEIFDLLRSGGDDALSRLFGTPERSRPPVGSVSVSANQAAPASLQFTSEVSAGQSLQVAPYERVRLQEPSGAEYNSEREEERANFARRLMMINQDMAVFGAPSGMDASRLDPRWAYIPELFVA